MVKEKIRKKTTFIQGSEIMKSLILHNDSVNHFDFVVMTLMEVCGHDPEQAEQCTLIAHFKGKCKIMKGKFDDLLSIKDKFSERNITVSIE